MATLTTRKGLQRVSAPTGTGGAALTDNLDALADRAFKAGYIVAASNAPDVVLEGADYVCDGTDDQVEMNAALTAANGQIPVLFVGQVNISDSIIVPPNSVLMGCGSTTSIIKLTADFAANSTAHQTVIRGGGALGLFKCGIITKSAVAGKFTVTMRDFEIDGNSENQTSQGVNIAGLMIQNVTKGVFENINAHDVNRAGFATDATTRQFCICTTETEYTRLLNCNAHRAGYEAGAIRDDSHHIDIWSMDCIADDDVRHAFQMSGVGTASSHIRIFGGRFHRDNITARISTFTDHGVSDVTVVGASFSAGPINFIDDCRRIKLIACDFHSGSRSMYFRSVKQVDIIGCQCAGPGTLVEITDTTSYVNEGIRFLGGGYRTISGSGIDLMNTNPMIGFVVENCHFDLTNSTIKVTGAGGATRPIIRNNTFSGNFGLTAGGKMTDALVRDNDFTRIGGAGNRITGVTGSITHNAGYVTHNSGTATVASGTTSIVVAHGLATTPSAEDIAVTATNSLGSATKFWVDTVDATNFTINVDADPGASTATFAWNVAVN